MFVLMWRLEIYRWSMSNHVKYLASDSATATLSGHGALGGAQPIAMCGGIEWDSRTSGSSYWSVDELLDGRICYSFDEDEQMFYILLEERDGRSDSEIALSLSRLTKTSRGTPQRWESCTRSRPRWADTSISQASQKIVLMTDEMCA